MGSLMRAAQIILGTLAVLLVNLVFSTGDFVEAPATALPSALALELVVLLAILAIAVRGRRRAPAWLLWPMAACLLAVGVLRALDTAIPWFFSRSFNLVVDLRFVPVIAGFLTSSVPLSDLLMLGAAAMLTVVGLVAGLRYALGAIAAAIATREWRPFALALATVAIGWALVPKAPSAEARRPLVTYDAAEVVGRQAELVLNAQGLRRDYLARIAAAQSARAPHRDLVRLGRHNVLLIFVESYGAVTFTDPGFAAQIDPVRARMAAQLQQAGFGVVSSTLRSPITGGGSWLAHTTMMTGVRIDDQPSFDVLMTTDFRAVAHDFAAAGYRSVAVMPRLDRPWPEGRLFGFSDIVLGPDMGYRGPHYSWESLPDQFVLDWVGRNILHGADRPVFAKIVLASSHTPFDRVPPLIDDWSTLGDGAIYAQRPGQVLPVRAGLIFEHNDGYLACLAYSLDAVGRFIAERIDDDTLVIVLGDHQPPLTTARSTRDRSVPIHVISRSAALLAPFRNRGYVDGLRPAHSTADTLMEEFLERFVADFSGVQAARAAQ